MDAAELIRLLENLIRVGVVTAIDEDNKRVRVATGGLDTTWLRWNAQRAGAFNIWMPPSLGEQVWLLCIGGNPETAIIGGSLYSNDHPAPGSSRNEMVITAPDGARFRYDADAGALEVSGVKTAKLTAEVKVLLDSPVVECTNLLKTRQFDVSEGGEMHGDFNHTGGAFVSNGVKVDDHDHGGVQRGGDWTEGTR
ncbi:phage baseplate assembly protein V [Serratia marcescens]|uniref:phage baseplate assembly protein V n=1 Tax=Serratia marcescens TaxID=615 RepID=UPI001BD5D659|nr:phage baseplate assembly protein V [Serratia marcescens]MDV5743102.1 phage baseplate assembly protein V [Serratia marcescens]MDV5748013.1 phage baseplate assembly protein V [Serratia marcescens]MDV5779450.1 phage baseplate assembly protein V [Serratia marcescens]MDV5784392.1 phage baseplate assembly protein V [Serratia marcescens]MDV5831289.1 phage baseplate assembly protein V [Serratia marcescens]